MINFPKRYILPLIFLLGCLQSVAQPTLYRRFTAVLTPPFPFTNTIPWVTCETPIATSDGGFLFVTRFYVVALENYAGNVLRCVIKTDANLVPQWKKEYHSACVLPTGGIVLYGQQGIEKVTNAGLTVWTRSITGAPFITDAVTYSTTIRFVGNRVTSQNIPFTNTSAFTADGLTIALDTNGNYLSQQLFYSSLVNTAAFNFNYRASAIFSRVKRDAAGNFYVYSNWQNYYGAGTQMAIAKFDASFNPVWAKTGVGFYGCISFTDIDVLPNGRIIASGQSSGSVPWGNNSYATFFKLSSNGSVLSQNYFTDRVYASDLCRLPSGNYVASAYKVDSLFMFELDTMLILQWHNYRAKAQGIGSSAIKNGTLVTSIFNAQRNCVITGSLNGQSCASLSRPALFPSASLALQDFTLTPVASTFTVLTVVSTATTYLSYQDTCVCTPYVSLTNSAICVGSSATVTAANAGGVNWYTTATGGSPIYTSSQFSVSASTPTMLTYYLDNLICLNGSPRVPVSINVQALPNLIFAPPNPSVCAGSTVAVAAAGALYYVWPGTTNQSSVNVFTPTASTVYTVTGAVNASCVDTKTIQMTVVPVQNVAIQGPSLACLGVPATYTASGTSNSIWYLNNPITGLTALGSASTAVFTPTQQGNNVLLYFSPATGGSCTTTPTINVTVAITPTITAVASPTLICGNGIATLSATGANNYTWTTLGVGSTKTVQVSNSTNFVVMSGIAPCAASVTLAVQVQALPQLTLTPPSQTVCSGASASINASGANSFTWHTTQVGASYSNTWSTGSYTVPVRGSIGSCTAASIASVQVNATPTIAIWSQWPYLCAGKSRTLTAYGANSYTWSNGAVSNTVQIFGISDTLVTVTGDANACLDSDTLSLEVKPNPTVTAVASTTSVCQYEKVELYAYGANYLGWTYPGTGSLSVIYPFNSVTLTAVGQNSFGCYDSTKVAINVKTRPTLTVSPKQYTICAGDMMVHTMQGAVTYSLNNTLSGDTIFTYPSLSQGYTIVGTGTNGCTGSTKVSVSVLECVGINENNTTNPTLEIYPNPSSGVFYLKYTDISASKPLLVYSADGRLLFKVPASAASIDLSGYAAGVYYVMEEGGLGRWRLVRG